MSPVTYETRGREGRREGSLGSKKSRSKESLCSLILGIDNQNTKFPHITTQLLIADRHSV
jgi:hypothetical protein